MFRKIKPWLIGISCVAVFVLFMKAYYANTPTAGKIEVGDSCWLIHPEKDLAVAKDQYIINGKTEVSPFFIPPSSAPYYLLERTESGYTVGIRLSNDSPIRTYKARIE